MDQDSQSKEPTSSSNSIALVDGSISLETTTMPMENLNNLLLIHNTKDHTNPALNKETTQIIHKINTKNNLVDPKTISAMRKKKYMILTSQKFKETSKHLIHILRENHSELTLETYPI